MVHPSIPNVGAGELSCDLEETQPPRMFGTLRYDSHNNNTEFEERATGVLLNDIGHLPQHSACDKCRAKKVLRPRQ